MNPKIDRPKRVSNVRVRRQEQETAVFNVLTAEYVILNLTGGAIWDLCDGDHTVASIASELRSKFINPPEESAILQDVVEIVDALSSKQLVEMVVC